MQDPNLIVREMLLACVKEPQRVNELIPALGKGLAVAIAMVEQDATRAELRDLVFSAITEQAETIHNAASAAMRDMEAFHRFLGRAIDG
jgi:hypothetical protein